VVARVNARSHTRPRSVALQPHQPSERKAMCAHVALQQQHCIATPHQARSSARRKYTRFCERCTECAMGSEEDQHTHRQAAASTTTQPPTTTHPQHREDSPPHVDAIRSVKILDRLSPFTAARSHDACVRACVRACASALHREHSCQRGLQRQRFSPASACV
jgi:hypothetical protein